jgi:alpha-L-fucosidase
MKKNLIIALMLLFVGVNAKKYEANWKSLDSRPNPIWFGDAKFGIFIHWGPYSVPAWSPAGTYTEWYQFWLQSKSIFGNNNPDKNAIPNFQNKLYGNESSYFDFGRKFKAELYNPEEWAQIFKNSGAKYVILTSKHHDGFTLWPNKHAQDGRGFKWNAKDVGPKKDLIKPYMKAMRDAGLKAGLYYSLYEWYHPWYYPMGMDNKKFVDEHYHPQFKDLVNNYAPDLIYADGEWDKPDSYWKSNELIQWLFNESPCKDYVVINDRWFKGARHKHGGYYTTEYLREKLDLPKEWEEIRGIGTSFGYNRDEDLSDYASGRQLVLMLCDIVSMGGNLCLNVGPRADGKIPVIQQERLAEIGDWLRVNGDAIYGTKAYKRACQWSNGNKNHDLKKHGQSYVTADYIEAQTIKPEKGMAVKEFFFTQKEENLYGIMPQFKNKVTIKDLKLNSNAKITLLGANVNCKWEKNGKDIEVSLPAYNPNWDINDLAYVLKIKR